MNGNKNNAKNGNYKQAVKPTGMLYKRKSAHKNEHFHESYIDCNWQIFYPEKITESNEVVAKKSMQRNRRWRWTWCQ